MTVRQKKSLRTSSHFNYLVFNFLLEERNLEYYILNIDENLMIMTVNSGRAALFLT